MNFELVAKETFEILRSFDYEVVMYDDEGDQVFEPEEGRRFFAKPDNLMVSIVDEGENSSVRLYFPKSKDIEEIFGLDQSLRVMATKKYKMTFNCRQSGKDDLNPKDFSTKASVREHKDYNMNLLEGMYGTSRSSYLKLENARMIVRHSRAVNENIVGARGRHIDSIYIENGIGERTLFPTTNLAPARAQTYHVNNGGSWADAVGQQINRMATDFADLASVSRHIGTYGGALEESCQEMRGKIREQIREMRRVFESLCRKTRYPSTAQALQELATTLTETEEVDLTEQVAALGKTLNVIEGREIAERALQTVASFMEGDRRFKMPLNHSSETVPVLGRSINKDAWEAMKAGNLELMGHVDLTVPEGGSREMKIAEIASRVAPRVRDDSLSNLIAFAADFIHEAPGDARSKMAGLCLLVADKLGIDREELGYDPKPSDGIARTPAVKQFAEWFDSHKTETALVENYYFRDRPAMSSDPRDGEYDSYADDIVGDVINGFDEGEFLSSPAAEEFMFDRRNELDPEERAFSREQVVSALENYLNDQFVGNEIHGQDASEEAEHLASRVIDYLKQEGYSIDEAEAEMAECEDDGAELSREDILLPKDKKQDLIDEISPAGDQTDHLNRMMSLAGVGRK